MKLRLVAALLPVLTLLAFMSPASSTPNTGVFCADMTNTAVTKLNFKLTVHSTPKYINNVIGKLRGTSAVLIEAKGTSPSTLAASIPKQLLSDTQKLIKFTSLLKKSKTILQKRANVARAAQEQVAYKKFISAGTSFIVNPVCVTATGGTSASTTSTLVDITKGSVKTVTDPATPAQIAQATTESLRTADLAQQFFNTHNVTLTRAVGVVNASYESQPAYSVTTPAATPGVPGVSVWYYAVVGSNLKPANIVVSWDALCIQVTFSGSKNTTPTSDGLCPNVAS